MLPLWLLLVGGAGHSAVPVLGASAIVASVVPASQVDHVGAEAERNHQVVVRSFVRLPGEEMWPAPELFFESEEELREHIDPEEDTERDRSNSTYVGFAALRPLVYSIHDPSAVVGRGRHFHAAPPLRVVLGVFRV